MRFGGVAAACVLLIATACNGDDESGDTTVPPSPTTGVGVTTSEPSASTTSAPPSTTATTTAPTTTATTQPPADTTSTTDAPVTTTTSPDDFSTQAALVLERTEASWDVVLTAFQDPFDDDKVAALADYFTGNQLEGFNNLIEEFRVGNFRAVPRPGVAEVYDADPRSLSLSLEAEFATVQVCHVDTYLVVETGGNSDGTDRVVTDEIDEQIVELDVTRIDGLWKVASARAPETEVAQCP